MACCSIHPSWPVQRSVGHKELNGDASVVSRHNSTKRQNTANVGKLGLTFSRPVKRQWRQFYQPAFLSMKFMHGLFKTGCASRTRRFAGCLSASKEIYGQFLTLFCSQGLISWYPGTTCRFQFYRWMKFLHADFHEVWIHQGFAISPKMWFHTCVSDCVITFWGKLQNLNGFTPRGKSTCRNFIQR